MTLLRCTWSDHRMSKKLLKGNESFIPPLSAPYVQQMNVVFWKRRMRETPVSLLCWVSRFSQTKSS